MPAKGGTVRRLTYRSVNRPHQGGKPAATPDNRVMGWTHNGQRVVFLSRRDSINLEMTNAYTVPLTGGLPTRLPIPWSGPLTVGPNNHTVAYNKLARR